MKKLIGGLPAEWMHETKVFTPQVIGMARLFGWRVSHFRPAQVRCKTCRGRGCQRCKFTGSSWRTAVSGDGGGFFDLTIVSRARRRIIFAELKSEKGSLTEEQVVWGKEVAGILTGVEYYVWRPSDLDDIERILKQ